MEKYKVDVSVLCLFFNRPEQFQKVFSVIKEAKPSRLFLYQDGPRSEKDMPGILACREIASQVDWECKVLTNYQEKNYGCDPSGYMSQKWAFSLTDKCVIIEDDVVANVDFFRFCKEMLDKYENDPRVSMITGINYEEKTMYCPYDYFFTSDVAIWGWASWSRVINARDINYTFLDSEYNKSLVKQNLKHKNLRDFMAKFEYHKTIEKQYFEFLTISTQLIQSGLCIVPKKNMIHNIGISGESTHFNGSTSSLRGGMKRIASMPTYSVDGEIRHPLYVMEDFSYNERVNRILLRNSPFMSFINSVSVFIARCLNGEFEAICKSIKRRL